MKMKNMVLGLLVIGSLTMVGCDDIEDTGSAIEENPSNKVEEKVMETCDVCGEEFNEDEMMTVDNYIMCKECGEWHKEEMSQYDEDNKSITVEEATELVNAKFEEYGVEGMIINELNDGFNDRDEFIYLEATRNPLHNEAGIIVKIDSHSKEMFIVGDDHAGKKITQPIDDVLKDATK